MKTVAVFFGGMSNEHEISVITGIYAANLLRGANYRVLPVYLTQTNEMTLFEDLRDVEEVLHFDKKKFRAVTLVRGGIAQGRRPKKIAVDCALNCCHGGMGEGGILSALLEWNEIPSASPGTPESAIFLDKALAKTAFMGLNLPVVPGIVLREERFKREDVVKEIVDNLGLPLIVKPSKGGSSVGISVADTPEKLERALVMCFKLDGVALIEKYLKGKRDLNCAAYCRNGEIVLSEVEEVLSDSEILTYEEKYESVGRRTSQLPANIPEETAARVKETLKKIYETFGVRGVVRADFLLCGDELYINELNTVPGTLALYLFGKSLLNARDLLSSLIEDALSRRRVEKQTVLTGILKRQPLGGKARSH